MKRLLIVLLTISILLTVASPAICLLNKSYTTKSDLLVVIDYDGGADPIYIGTAPPGTAVGEPGWQIKKLTYDAGTNVTAVKFADDTNDYMKIWNNRATYSY